MPEPAHRSSKVALLALAAAALWLLTGALFKLLAGSPKLLPPLVSSLSPFGADLSFRLVIACELALVSLALIKPRLGWLPLALVYVFFEVVLVSQQAAGAESCGCLGDTIKVPPALMMAVDGVLLAGLLLTRPWRNLAGGGSLLLLAACLTLSAAAPWALIAAAAPPVAPGIGGSAASPRYLVMEPARWVGREIHDVPEIAGYVPAEQLPTDGLVVLWRQSCDHCAEHLRELVRGDRGERPILLLQIQDDLKAARVVDALPAGPHVITAQLPAGLDVVLQTPWELVVEGGTITRATDASVAPR